MKNLLKQYTLRYNKIHSSDRIYNLLISLDINNFISLCKSERNKTLSNIERIEASELNQTKEEFYFSTLDDNKKLYTRLLTY